MPMPPTDPSFPCALTISIPFPTHRLAHTALRALAVDQELSPLVRRSFSLAASNSPSSAPKAASTTSSNATATATGTATAPTKSQPSNSSNTTAAQPTPADPATKLTVLLVHYAATTHPMLRVAVNGFFETLRVVIGVMQELDTDVLGAAWASHQPGSTEGEGREGLDEGLNDGLEGVQGVEVGMGGVGTGVSVGGT